MSDELYEATRAIFSEDEIVQLTMCVITINAWNRLGVAFRAPVGVHVPRGKPSAPDPEAHTPSATAGAAR